MYRAGAEFARRYHEHRLIDRTPPRMSPRETRDELLDRARRTLEFIRSKRTNPSLVRPVTDEHGFPPICPFASVPAYFRSEVDQALSDARHFRQEAMKRQSPDRPDRVFYVSVRDGEKHAFLFGPLPSQRAALRELPRIRNLTLEKYREAAFAAFGTCSYDGPNPPTALFAA